MSCPMCPPVTSPAWLRRPSRPRVGPDPSTAGPPSSPAGPAASAGPSPRGSPRTARGSSSRPRRVRRQGVATDLGGEHLVADLSDGTSIEELGLGTAVQADILVNNAGVQHVRRWRTSTPTVRVHPAADARGAVPAGPGAAPGHVRAWLRPARARLLGARPPRLAVQVGLRGAKHGLEGLSKVIALEAAGRGVTSNTVCPGYVRTPLVEGQIADQARTHGIAEDKVLDGVILARTPVSGSSSPRRWPTWSPSSAGPAPTRSPAAHF